MKAIRIGAFGGPEQMELANVPAPAPAAGEVLVAVETAGVNYIDVYMRNGSYRRSHTYVTPLPMVLGMEGAGRITALGAGVSGWAIGDRVAYCLSRGSYAELAAVAAWRLVRIPDDVPTPVAAALMLQGFTAHYLTHSAFPLGPVHTCLVHAGAGGVGQLLIQLAKARGARVITTAGSPEKAGIARQRGADATILYREESFPEAVRKLTGGRGVDVVYDSVGRDTLPGSLASLSKRGLVVSFGASSGQPEPIALLDLAEAGSVFITRPHLADYISTAEEITARAADLFARWRAGGLAVTIDRELPLAEAAQAHGALEARRTRGKILLRVREGGAG